MLKIDPRFILFAFAAMLAAAPITAQAQRAPTADEKQYAFPGPETEWQLLGYKEPNQAMIIRRASPAKDGLPRAQVLFIYSPPTQGVDRIDNYYSADCARNKMRDDGGTYWTDGEYQGISPSETDSGLADADPGTVHEAIMKFICGSGPALGAAHKRDEAVSVSVERMKQQQQAK